MFSSIFSDLEEIADFEYIEAKEIKEACSLLAQHKEKARMIAGGTKLLPSIKSGEISPEFVISLKNIPKLEYITHSDTEGLRIGALTTLNEIENSPVVRQNFAILAQAVQERRVATIQPRWAYYMATIGGSFASLSPPADIAVSLFVLGAKAVIEGNKGQRVIPIEEFFTGPDENILQNSDEMLSGIRAPRLPANTGTAYMKHPTTEDIPAFNVAALLTLDKKQVTMEDIKIAIGAEAFILSRAPSAEAIIKGKAIDKHLIEQAAQAAAEESTPTSGIADTVLYQQAVKKLVNRAIRQVVDDAIGDYAMGY